jgi:hypothetical protein
MFVLEREESVRSSLGEAHHGRRRRPRGRTQRQESPKPDGLDKELQSTSGLFRFMTTTNGATSRPARAGITARARTLAIVAVQARSRSVASAAARRWPLGGTLDARRRAM